MYWDKPVLTDRTVDHNRPDILLIDKKKKEGVIIDIAVPLSHNIKQKEIEKISKYENLSYELKHIWKLNVTKTYPLVISAEDLVSKNFLKYLKELQLPKNVLNMGQRAVLLQTAHIVRKFMS